MPATVTPEQLPPEPITQPAGPVPAGVSGRRPATTTEVLLSIVPGLGHLVRGEWVPGMLLLLGWGFTLSLAFLTRAKIGAVFTARRMPIDAVVAVVTLVVTALLLWGWAFRDLAVKSRRQKRLHGDSQWSIAARHFRKNRLAIAGLVVMLLLYLVTLVTPLIAPYDPVEQGNIILSRYLAPSMQHLMGTDKFGRDIFSRVLYGARISLSIGFIAVGISITLGTLIGALAGYFGGIVDGILMRFTDMMLSFPRLVLLIVVIALFEPSIYIVVIVLGLTGWMGTARLVRGEVLSLREREFVQAARALGMGDWRIIFRHVIPNTMAPVIVSATLGIGQTILTEASLSFLGLGVQSPTPSWGNMVSDGRDALVNAWWIATFPGLAIVVTVVAFNLLGDGLRDALDPRLRT
ncbi:ABC-type dipeptide/oligopeptide/nickel transport system, permease component [bacterium JGI 053]|nr:ABC-type dipeptide/oligopeptide/nickel transport system, permease component [bacterium JGI 053]